MYLAAIADSQPQPPTMHAQVQMPLRNVKYVNAGLNYCDHAFAPSIATSL